MNHELLKVQTAVLLCLFEAPQEGEVGPRVLEILGGQLGWELGALWEIEDDLLVARWQWRSPRLPPSAVEAETAKLQLPRGRGLPGAAWERAQLVWSADVASEPDFLRAASARADHLRGAMFIPLVAGDRVVGVLELLRREPVAPDREVIDALAALGRAIGTYLERARSRAELEAMLVALDRQLHERESRLAREIHDVLGQELTGLKLDAAWVARQLSGAALDPRVLIERLEAMCDSIDGMLRVERRISRDLRAGMLDELGLAAALESHARELTARSGLEIELALEELPEVDRAVAHAMFRAAQELLTNIVRHAHARHAWISLREAGGFLELRVRDDGRGIDLSAISSTGSLGLLGVRERARAYGGSFEISQRDRTEAVLRLPIAAPGAPP